MLRVLSIVLAAGLCGPAAGQLISPALEAEGAQTQTLDVLDEAVSVEVESSGSSDLGGQSPQAGGAVGVSINDVTVGVSLGDQEGQDTDEPAQTSPSGGTATASQEFPSGSGEASTQGDASTPVAEPTNRSSAQVTGSVESGLIRSAEPTQCLASVVDTDRIVAALNAGLGVRIMSSECQGVAPDVGRIVAAIEPLAVAVTAVDIQPEQVFSITIADEHVILHSATGR